MDYGDGTRLVHTDWAQIHNPEMMRMGNSHIYT